MAYVLVRELLAGKYMSQMSAAGRTQNLRTTTIGIRLTANSTRYLIVEARPTATSIKFIFRAIQRSAAPTATIRSICTMGVVFAGKGHFCPFSDNYSLFFGSQRFHILCI